MRYILLASYLLTGIWLVYSALSKEDRIIITIDNHYDGYWYTPAVYHRTNSDI